MLGIGLQLPWRGWLAVPGDPSVFNVLDYGAVGDGETDDTEAIQDALDAAAIVGGTVYMPAGTYLVVPLAGEVYALLLASNVRILGDGLLTIITIPNQESSIRFVFYGSGVDFAQIAEMTITTPDPGNLATVAEWFTSAIALIGSDNCSITNVRVEHMRQGVKVGSGTTCNDLVVSGLVAHDCITAFYAANLDGATFTDCDLQVVDNDTINNHCLYLEKEVHNVDFVDSAFSGAGGYVIHCYLEGAYTSSYVSFNNCDFVSSEQTVLIGSKWSYVSFVNGCDFDCDRSAGPFLFYGGDHITVENFTASSPYYLLSREETVTNVLFKNGTFDGTALMPQSQDGITFDNVSIV